MFLGAKKATIEQLVKRVTEGVTIDGKSDIGGFTEEQEVDKGTWR